MGIMAACADQPSLSMATRLPANWQYAAASAPAAWPSEHWVEAFGNSELAALAIAADSSNQDLAAAMARVRQANARRAGAGAALLPVIGAGATFTSISGRSQGQSAHENDYGALLWASYEVDFWGGKRAARSAADAATVAVRADRATLALTITAAVANEYFQVLALRERLAAAKDTLAVAQGVLEVVLARYQAGAASVVELALQRSELANAQLAMAHWVSQEVEHRAALALLAGRLPEGFDVKGAPLASIQELRAAPGLPSELLVRRPDLMAAEANLRAAHADIGVARAALFPTLSLSATGGLQNPGFQAAYLTLPGTGAAFAASASLLQTLFDGGRRRALKAEAEAREQELLADYRAAILHAYADVETALANMAQLDLQQAAQDEGVARSEQALAGARARFQEGAGEFSVVLEAQRGLNAARDQFIQYQLARLQAQISLCKALGGGWQADQRASAPVIKTNARSQQP
jgi:NodT family efflux transporter outer membrane factor (OMF) lipoprotein